MTSEPSKENNLVFDGSQKRRVKWSRAFIKNWDIFAAYPNMNVNEINIAWYHRLGHF